MRIFEALHPSVLMWTKFPQRSFIIWSIFLTISNTEVRFGLLIIVLLFFLFNYFSDLALIFYFFSLWFYFLFLLDLLGILLSVFFVLVWFGFFVLIWFGLFVLFEFCLLFFPHYLISLLLQFFIYVSIQLWKVQVDSHY